MRELNIRFQEDYKRLDKLCKDINTGGISVYIQDMERTPYTDRKAVADWDRIYRQLKHMRWKRNQLAHEINIDTDFCEQNDIDWLQRFYNSILQRTDPLALVYSSKKQTDEKTVTSPMLKTEKTTEKQPQKSFWRRVISKIKRFFS